jgi:hypothetical protein
MYISYFFSNIFISFLYDQGETKLIDHSLIIEKMSDYSILHLMSEIIFDFVIVSFLFSI